MKKYLLPQTGNFYKAIRLGYILISILIVCMAYNSLYEWQEIEALELGNKKIDELRKEINNINIQMIKFSLLGETILEWNDKDIEHYHARRMAMDSMLCRFKATYPAERIDSVRSLLEDKERQMFQIVRLMDEQQSINKKIANQIPVIVQKSVQEQSKKPKRKGFLGIFGKKKEVTPAVSTTILHSVNRNVISEQKVQDRQLSEQADSLAARNAELNRQLQELICQIEEKVQTELQSRENEIVAMREKSFMPVGGLMGFVLLLLLISYIIIHRDAKSIKQYKHKTTDLIRQLEQSRQFYRTYPIANTLRSQLNWSQYRRLIQIEDPDKREYYELESVNGGWTARETERQINSMLYERLLLSNEKEKVLAVARNQRIPESPTEVIKDPMVLEFLGLERKAAYYEKDLESAIISHIAEFLLEMGKGFSFVAKQKRILLEDDEFFADLVFYNRLLRCFVVVELKTGKLTHQDLGQLQMYVNYYDRCEKQEDENPTIGILLCSDKNDTVVKMALPEENSTILASKYQLYLPTTEQLIKEIDEVKQLNI